MGAQALHEHGAASLEAMTGLEFDPELQVRLQAVGPLELDIVLASCNGTKVGAFRGSKGRPLFGEAVEPLPEEGPAAAIVRLHALPAACSTLLLLAKCSVCCDDQEAPCASMANVRVDVVKGSTSWTASRPVTVPWPVQADANGGGGHR